MLSRQLRTNDFNKAYVTFSYWLKPDHTVHTSPTLNLNFQVLSNVIICKGRNCMNYKEAFLSYYKNFYVLYVGNNTRGVMIQAFVMQY